MPVLSTNRGRWCRIACAVVSAMGVGTTLVGCIEGSSSVTARETQATSTANGTSTETVAAPKSAAPAVGEQANGPELALAEASAVKAPAGTSVSEWPGFRGPTGMGTTEAKGLPVTWSGTENIAWKVPLPGPGASSPVVYEDRIYITCQSGYIPEQSVGTLDDLKRHLIALKRTDGSEIWNKAIAATLPEEKRIRDHGFAANTPAVDAERVYVFFGKTGVFAFDHSGKQIWQADVGSNTNGWGTSASPVLYKDLVFINASVESSSLIALDRKTGEERWRAKGIRESWNTPVIVKAPSGRDELIVAIQGKVLAFDPDKGDQLWSCKTDIGWYMVPSVVAEDGIVYCLGGRSGVAALAVKAGGSGDVTSTHRLWTSVKGSNVSSPVFHKGHLYWMHEQRGVAYCAKGDSGDVLYENRLDRAGQVYSSALLAEGHIYYLTREGKTFVIAADPEFKQLAMNDLGDRSTFNGSPCIDGKRLLIRSDKFLYCIGK